MFTYTISHGLVYISVTTAPYLPHASSNENGSYLTTFTVYTGTVFGYFMAIAHESFYAYIILHGFFQMHTLRAYLRHEFCQYEKVDLNEIINSFRYQSLIDGALLRCIKQHKRLVT